MTASAITLGVMFATGTLVLTDTAAALFQRQFVRASGGVDAVVRDATGSNLAMGVEADREPVPPGIANRIRKLPGVGQVAGVVLGSAPLAVAGKPVVAAEGSLGMSWVDAPLTPFRLRFGRAPQEAGEIVIDAATASSEQLQVGDSITVSIDGRSHRHTVVGTVGFGDAAGMPGTTIAMFAPEAAQALFELGASWSEIYVAADAISSEELRRRLTAELGDRFFVAGTQNIAAARAQDAQRQLRFLTAILVMLAATSLVVAVFMILNTFAILVAQRTREFATLRAVGATARQIRLSVVAEALALGVVASTPGIALGVATATALRSLSRTFGVVVPDGALTVQPRTVGLGVAIGVGVTVLAALLPALRAGRVSPVAAMRENDTTPPPASRFRGVAGTILVGVGGFMVATGTVTNSIPLTGFGAVAVLAAVVLLGPLFAGRLAAAVGRPLDRGGAPTHLARMNVRRHPRRTAATSAALVVGLGVVSFMTVVATSAKQAVDRGVDEVLKADLVIQSVGGMMAGFSHHVHHYSSEVDGVEVASRMRQGHWRTSTGMMNALTAVDPQTLHAVTDVDVISGDLAGLERGGVVVAERVAARHGVAVGDPLEMTFERTGDHSLPVVAVIDSQDAWAFGTDYAVSLDTFAQHFADDADTTVLLRLNEDVNHAAVREAVQDAIKDYPTAAISDHAQIKAVETEMFDGMLGLVTVLLMLTVAVALFGIMNTLGLSIIERTREIGMLRAVGMTRRQVRRMVRIEAALIALVGGVTGVALGLLLAMATVHALSHTVVIGLVLPLPQLLMFLLVAAVGGLIAGVFPGRRAAQMDVLSAVASP